ncbi:unnamed protein product [Nesidiocoris tenuis]|uniref:Uncharacterized protein n=1 Tax=Nesidiocoris tenuis TaxID=355587 RepID=A0A6H5FY50_9HEMI|nr:unnamed protein product [Nesidiocoris tenuis]
MKNMRFIGLNIRAIWWSKNLVSGPIVSIGLYDEPHSRARSRYCRPRGLLAAGFPPWPVSPLLSEPGDVELPRRHHVDGQLSADTWSTQKHRRTVNPDLKPSSETDLQVAGLQEHATTPSRKLKG